MHIYEKTVKERFGGVLKKGLHKKEKYILWAFYALLAVGLIVGYLFEAGILPVKV